MFKKIFLNIAIVVSVLLSNLSYSQQTKIQEAEEKEFFLQEIEVKEGQTLSYIANYYLKDPKQWPEILKYNKLSTSDIYAPLPGMKLKVPILIVKEKFRPAYLIYILNNVKYRKRNTVSWEEPQINMELYNDDAITTYENSRANIKFYSGEILSIDENSFVTIRPELKQEEVRLHKGGVRATKAKVITETAEVVPKIDPKLPKTDFRTKFRAEDKTTLVEVYDGAVNVTAEGKTIYVPKGFGTEVKLLSPPSTPKPLPPPPEIAFKTESVKFTSDNELVLSKSLPNVSFQLQEPKIETLPFVADTKQNEKQKLTPQPLDYSKPKILGNIIKKYHIQIAKDIEFKKVVYDEVGDIRPDKTINFDISKLQLSDGRYYYKISYIDELGFENPATPRVFIVDTTPPKLEIDPSLGTKTDKDVIHITGRTEPDSILIANNKKVDVDKDGNFTFAEVLKLGINKIQLVAKDRFDNETKLELEIERVKMLTKEEKIKMGKKEEKTSSGFLLGTILISIISSAIVSFVLFFFLK